MDEYGPLENVYVEGEWWDGPRAGIADVDGRPHRFKALFDEDDDGDLKPFLVWPIHEDELQLEIEQWRIFVEWNRRYEARLARTDSHPANGGISRRWDELQALLRTRSTEVPPEARRAAARFVRIDGASRYDFSGPCYRVQWEFL